MGIDMIIPMKTTSRGRSWGYVYGSTSGNNLVLVTHINKVIFTSQLNDAAIIFDVTSIFDINEYPIIALIMWN